MFQCRKDGSVDFYRNWTDYKKGFGDLNGEFWLGRLIQISVLCAEDLFTCACMSGVYHGEVMICIAKRDTLEIIILIFS